jgi:hypothetical protein
MSLADLEKRVRDEVLEADLRYGPFTSTHEGFGVLSEEVAELLDAIRANNAGQIELEAIQVSAVALRIAWSTSFPDTYNRSGLEKK